MSKLLKGLLLGAPVSIGALAVGVLLEGCGSEAEEPAKQPVSLHTRVELQSTALQGFTTALGWNVTLSQALISTGAFYYFDGAPKAMAALECGSRGSELSRWLGISSAFAHPGHGTSGNLLGQMLEPFSIDLLAGPAMFPEGDGFAGLYRSGQFSFSAPAAGPMVDLLEGHVALVVGSAQKEAEETRFFKAYADHGEFAQNAEISGAAFAEMQVQGDGTVMIEIDPKVWLDLADFSILEPGTADAPTELAPGSQPKIAFRQGLAQPSAYKFSYVSDTP
jgi:hypothetical protein